MDETNQNPVDLLVKRVKEAEMPEELENQVLTRLDQLSDLSQSSSFLPELDRMNRYILWITKIPWNKRTTDMLDLNRAREMLDKNHYGLTQLKERVLEYIAVMQLKGANEQNIARAPILCFVGLVGTGKTTFAFSIAEALGRKIARIPFGGMGDPLDLRGRSRMYAEAEPGKIIKALVNTQSRNPVILLDEIDRVTDEGRASIMGVLVELLDPQQNQAFVDHYIDFPVNLSEAIFVATANNTTNIATAVMDRLEPISMPSYSDEEKKTIAEKYVLPKALTEAGIDPKAVTIAEDAWPKFVRPLGYDAGIRTLERTIQGMVRKVARMIVEGKVQNVKITADNVKQFVPQW
jgi:ATP-dependent Lon protease